MELTNEQLGFIETCAVAIVVTNGHDGKPHVSATWFLVGEDRRLRVSIAERGQKAKNLARDRSATLFFIDRETGLHTLEIRGTVTVEDDPDFAFARKLGEKVGDDLTRYVEPGEGRLKVTMEPERVVEFSVG